MKRQPRWWVWVGLMLVFALAGWSLKRTIGMATDATSAFDDQGQSARQLADALGE